MREITASTKYIKMKEIKAGDVLVKKGKFTGTRAGKFGDTLIFRESTGEEIGLSASGQLKSLIERELLIVGDTYQINYKGKVDLKDGRTANDFQILVYEDEQLDLFEKKGDIYGEENLEIE